MMVTSYRGLGEDPLANLPLSVTSRDMTAYALNIFGPAQLPGVTTGSGSQAAPEDTNKQTCLVGEVSPDPLIPGVCNTTVLVGAIVALAVIIMLRQ